MLSEPSASVREMRPSGSGTVLPAPARVASSAYSAAASSASAAAEYAELATRAGAGNTVPDPDGLISRTDALGSESIRYAARRLGAMPTPVNARAPVKKPAAAPAASPTPKAA